MSEHTQEPWATDYRENGEGMFSQEIFDADGKTIATLSWFSVKIDDKTTGTNRRQNARRIVACVNACAGLKTELLEAPGTIADVLVLYRQRREANACPHCGAAPLILNTAPSVQGGGANAWSDIPVCSACRNPIKVNPYSQGGKDV